jgi:sulfate adenylyltransferase subunit 1
MIILIDAQNGITAQTRRHSMVASFLKLGKVVVSINKMDLSNYSQEVYESIKDEYLQIAAKLNLHNVTFIPISALEGDNVITLSRKTPWYIGPALLELLETYKPAVHQYAGLRLSLQYQIGDNTFAGKILSGTLHNGDKILVHPDGESATVSNIIHHYDNVEVAHAGDNISISLQENIALKRGDIISLPQDIPSTGGSFEADLCWMDSTSVLDMAKTYVLRINAAETECTIGKLEYKVNIDTLENFSDAGPVTANQFARVEIEISGKLAWDHIATLPENSRGILVDPATNNTVGAFVIT